MGMLYQAVTDWLVRGSNLTGVTVTGWISATTAVSMNFWWRAASGTPQIQIQISPEDHDKMTGFNQEIAQDYITDTIEITAATTVTGAPGERFDPPAELDAPFKSYRMVITGDATDAYLAVTRQGA